MHFRCHKILRIATSEKELRDMALSLALEANARRIAAEKILEALTVAPETPEAEPEKEKKEKKEKKKDRESKSDTNE